MKTNAFVRQLASNKRATRENALKTLKKFLSSKEKMSKLKSDDFNKLWKGMFYTMWFSDRPRPQQRLANELAGLFSQDIDEEYFNKFVESYWIIMAREWKDLDKWRVDKFLMLMRYVIRECLRRLYDNDFNDVQVSSYMEVLQKHVLKDDEKAPKAITYHIIDVWVDEFERVIFGEEEDEEDGEQEEDREKRIKERKQILEEKQVPIQQLFEPFVEMSRKGHNEPLRKKILVEVLEDERLLELDLGLVPVEEEEAEAEEAESEQEESVEVFKL